MPLKMPASLRFAPAGSGVPFDPDAVGELLALATKVQSPDGYKYALEIFKKHFCRSTRKQYAPSSNVDWAEHDLRRVADSAADDTPAFIVAFCDACEELEATGATVPDHAAVNGVLATYGCAFHIAEGELIGSAPNVAPPTPPFRPDDAVARALGDAAVLVRQSGAASGIDRAHTALHGYLVHLCSEAGIDVPSNAATTKLFKLLRKDHPALQPRGPRADDITRVLQSFAAAIDALSPIRNKASLVHPNPLLDEPEAVAALNAARTLFHYIQDSVRRHNRAGAT